MSELVDELHLIDALCPQHLKTMLEMSRYLTRNMRGPLAVVALALAVAYSVAC